MKLYERENGIQVMACAGQCQQDVTRGMPPVIYIRNKRTGGTMKIKESDTAKLIRSTELQRKSDASCKQVLKSEWILAFILKDMIPECEGCSLEEIVEKYIETDKISEEIPGRDRIEGLDKDDTDMDAATVFSISGFRHCCQTVPEHGFISILTWKHKIGTIQDIHWKSGLSLHPAVEPLQNMKWRKKTFLEI